MATKFIGFGLNRLHECDRRLTTTQATEKCVAISGIAQWLLSTEIWNRNRVQLPPSFMLKFLPISG